MNGVQLFVKRMFDIVFSLLGLILLLPLYIIIYITLKLTTRDSVIFRQERVGRGGVPFCIYKFRTLTESPDVEPTLRAELDDNMATPFQRLLRRVHLDELPQLWNVLRGDMSIVGPRPERQCFIDLINERSGDYPIVLEMRPGITSEAAIYNGYTDNVEKMLKRMELDIRYLKHRTLWMDVTIIYDTLIAIIKK